MCLKKLSILLLSFLLSSPVFAMGLHVEPAQKNCDLSPAPALQATPDMALRLIGSHIARGTQDIVAVWLTSPTLRYPHSALGSATHAGSVTVQLASDKAVVYELPLASQWAMDGAIRCNGAACQG